MEIKLFFILWFLLSIICPYFFLYFWTERLFWLDQHFICMSVCLSHNCGHSLLAIVMKIGNNLLCTKAQWHVYKDFFPSCLKVGAIFWGFYCSQNYYCNLCKYKLYFSFFSFSTTLFSFFVSCYLLVSSATAISVMLLDLTEPS